MARLPPILARDYRRNVHWPVVHYFIASAGAGASIGLIILAIVRVIP
jgi:hypothetical protein